MVNKSYGERKVRSIILTAFRVVLFASAIYAYYYNRNLLLVTSLLAIFLTFVPFMYKTFYKKDSNTLYDIILIFILFGVFSFWEIRGTYANSFILALLMNLSEAIAIGLLGFTLVYSYFKYSHIEEHHAAISLFSFCLTFSLGTLFEISEILIDGLFRFKIHDSGLYGTVGDLSIYLAGSLVISFFGYYSLRKGRPLLVSKYLETFVEKNQHLLGKPSYLDEDHPKRIKELIAQGESHKLEFKSTLRKNLHTNIVDSQIEHATLKTINAYLNSDGGTLIVGVSDKGEIKGIEADQFLNDDHAQRHLMQLINEYLGPEYNTLVNIKVVMIEDKKVLLVECKKSDKESFIKKGKDEQFYVRQGSLSLPLSGSTLIKYIENNFREKK